MVLLATIHEYRSILLNSLGDFGHIKPGAVIVAVFLESVSMAAFARMQRRVLKSAGLNLTIESMLAITYAGNAIAVTLPLAGSGLGTAFLHREFSARGATHSVAAWALLLSGVYSTVAFGLIISIGALTSGNLAAEFAGVAGVAVVVLPLAGLDRRYETSPHPGEARGDFCLDPQAGPADHQEARRRPGD